LPFRLVLPLVLACLPAVLYAQSAADVDSVTAPAPPVIRAIRLERRDIFDPHERSWLARLANALHLETRAPTIRRELLFRVGEPYDSAREAESERNLRALGVFRRVQIDTVQTDTGVVMKVVTRDGWSTRMDWRFRSTGGDIEFTIGMVEDNLLGTASSASVRYRKTPDRSTVALGFRRPRLFVGRIGLTLAYEDRSDGRLNLASLEQPFYALTSPFAFRLDAEDRDERVLRFFEGAEEAQDTLRRRYTLTRWTSAWALQKSSEGYLRLGLQGQVRRDDFLPEGSGLAFPRTVTGAFGPYVVWNRAKFLVTEGVAGFSREEDVDIGTTVRAGFNLAPKAFGYDRNGVAPLVSARVGVEIPGGFGYIEGLAGALYSSAGLDSGAVQVGVTAATKPFPRQVLILHAEAGWLKNPLPGAEFDLGLGTGPRAFGDHAFTGDRTFMATAEYRVTVVENFLGLMGLGVAGFVDHGGAWYEGSPRRVGWDAGLGLRMGSTRASATEAVRFDLAHRFANDVEQAGWVLTVGKGFVFSTVGRRAL
jgi:hypothetical protein